MKIRQFFQIFLRTVFIKFLPKKIISFFSYKCDFVFVVNLPNLSVIPAGKFYNFFLKHNYFKKFPPLITAPIVGFKDSNKKVVKGWLIICFLTAKEIVSDMEIASKKIFEAVRLAEKLQAKIVSLGAFTSIAVHDGLDFVNKVDVGITTGNAYSALVAIKNVQKIAKIKNINLNNSVVAVVGAVGSVGSGCVSYLTKRVKRLLLVDINLVALRALADRLNSEQIDVEISSQIDIIKDAEIVIVVTSATSGLVEKKHLKRNAIVVDGAFPPNVPKETIKSRPDVLVVSSAIVKVPGVSCDFNFGLGKEEVYGCLAEALILIWMRRQDHYALGKVSLHFMKEMERKADELGFEVADFRNHYLGLIKHI